MMKKDNEIIVVEDQEKLRALIKEEKIRGYIFCINGQYIFIKKSNVEPA